MPRNGTAFGVVGVSDTVSGGYMAQPTCRTDTNSDSVLRSQATHQCAQDQGRKTVK